MSNCQITISNCQIFLSYPFWQADIIFWKYKASQNSKFHSSNSYVDLPEHYLNFLENWMDTMMVFSGTNIFLWQETCIKILIVVIIFWQVQEI